MMGIDPDSWGPWTLDPERLTLDVFAPNGNHRYDVDLEWCVTAGGLCDAIFQVNGKRWADQRTMAGLVEALDDVLTPQAHICSFRASDLEMTPEKLREVVVGAVERGAPVCRVGS